MRLEELHRPKSSQNFVYVRTKLDRIRLEEITPGTMQAHIAELRDVMDQLTDLGEPLKPMETPGGRGASPQLHHAQGLLHGDCDPQQWTDGGPDLRQSGSDPPCGGAPPRSGRV